MKKLVCLAVVLASSTAYAGIWDEFTNGGGDAGDLLGTAQITNGVGSLDTITGAIASPDVDLFAIYIDDFANFSATTVGLTSWDTRLFLFDDQGMGVTFNDDDPGGGLQSTLTSQFLTGNGLYYLAIGRYSSMAQDGAGQDIWLGTPFNVERAPDGPGAPGPLAMWNITASSAGDYTIDLTGATYAIPGPGALALLGLAGLLSRRRR